MKAQVFLVCFLLSCFADGESVSELNKDWSESGCSHTIHDEEGKITSPVTKPSTQQDIYCEWQINTPEETNAVVQFSSFNIEYHEFCKWGFVEIYFGNDTNDQKCDDVKLCGKLDLREKWEFETNSFLVIFYANKLKFYQGFTLHWDSVDPNAIDEFKTCGKQALMPEFATKYLKVLNGNISPEEFRYTNASEGSWPWQAFLNIGYKSYQKICQASILSPNVVITAAHCIENGNMLREDLFVFVGKHLSSVWEATEQIFKVKRLHIHEYRSLPNCKLIPSFKNDGICDYDLAFLELEDEIQYSPYIRPVCLHLSGPRGKLCIATGWNVQYTVSAAGVIELTGKSNSLKELEITFYEKHTCDLLLAENYYITSRNHNFLCGTSGTLEGVTNAALNEGDSGAPIVCYQNEQWELVAIHTASMKYGAIGKIVHLFMKVNNFWVKKKLGIPVLSDDLFDELLL